MIQHVEESCPHGKHPDLCDECSEEELKHCLVYDHDTIRFVWRQYHRVYKVVVGKKEVEKA